MRVDLRSDTVTRPTPAMKQAMIEAPLGDDVLGDDPSVQSLEAEVAALLGKETAIFVPSGTMANQIAIRLHTQPGDEAVMEAGAHPFNHEAGAAALLSGVQVRPVVGPRGILDPAAVAACFKPANPHVAPVTLVCAEDTSNRGGGSVYPVDVLDELARVAHARGTRAHLDGARLWNAAVQSGIAASRRARDFDTVSVCFSKGLGAPVGSALCLPSALRERAVRFRKVLGGGMRQSGLLAAAGSYALRHHIERLQDDHERARMLSRGLQALGLATQEPETNMVYVEVPDGPAWEAALAEHGVLCLAVGPSTLRLVTHLDVDDLGLDRALGAFKQVVDEAR